MKIFCRGFREYPFSVDALYSSPKSLGMANLWSLTPDEKQSGMVCYSFDDYESWTIPYGYDTYTNCMKRLLADWHEGCQRLEHVKGAKARELALFAKVATLHFEADLLQTEYAYYKRDLPHNQAALSAVTQAARECTADLLKLVDKDARIAFETSNHYFYTSRNLLEQYLHLSLMLDQLQAAQ